MVEHDYLCSFVYMQMARDEASHVFNPLNRDYSRAYALEAYGYFADFDKKIGRMINKDERDSFADTIVEIVDELSDFSADLEKEMAKIVDSNLVDGDRDMLVHFLLMKQYLIASHNHWVTATGKNMATIQRITNTLSQFGKHFAIKCKNGAVLQADGVDIVGIFKKMEREIKEI